MCPKCKAKIFKPFEGGKCCVYCGTLVLDPLEVAKVIDHKIRDYQRFPDVPYEPKPFDSNNSNTARAIRARAYILTVFEYIQNELWRLKSWHEIDKALTPREDCLCVKSLRKYYHAEVTRRTKAAPLSGKCEIE